VGPEPAARRLCVGGRDARPTQLVHARSEVHAEMRGVATAAGPGGGWLVPFSVYGEGWQAPQAPDGMGLRAGARRAPALRGRAGRPPYPDSLGAM